MAKQFRVNELILSGKSITFDSNNTSQFLRKDGLFSSVGGVTSIMPYGSFTGSPLSGQITFLPQAPLVFTYLGAGVIQMQITGSNYILRSETGAFASAINLAATGSNLQSQIFALSGNLSATGSNLQSQITALSAGSTTINRTEIDFGSTPVSSASFLITNASITTGNNIIAQQAYVAATDKDLDENEMDVLDLRCQPSGGGFSLFAQSSDGSYLADKFVINYLIG